MIVKMKSIDTVVKGLKGFGKFVEFETGWDLIKKYHSNKPYCEECLAMGFASRYIFAPAQTVMLYGILRNPVDLENTASALLIFGYMEAGKLGLYLYAKNKTAEHDKWKPEKETPVNPRTQT